MIYYDLWVPAATFMFQNISCQAHPFKGKAVHFLGTAAGLSIGQDALGQNVNSPHMWALQGLPFSK